MWGSLLDLLSPEGSCLVAAQAQCFRLLADWRQDADCAWFAASLAGADFGNDGLRLLARAQCLQAAGGIFDSFEMRYRRAPYSLCILATSAPPDAKDKALDAFLSEPIACLPLLCKRMKELYPSKQQLLKQGGESVEAWARSTMVNIGASERAHALMRTDISSAGPGRNPCVSANRVFCRQMRAHHEALGGHAPQLAGAGPPSESAGQLAARRGVGGNPRIEHLNNRRHACKALHAPFRSLTPDEMRKCDQGAAAEWQVVAADPVQVEAWRPCHYASQLGRSAKTKAAIGCGDIAFKGVWGLSQVRHEVLQLPTLQEHGLHRPLSREEHQKVWHSDDLIVRAALDRRGGIPSASRVKIDGCFNDRKSVVERRV